MKNTIFILILGLFIFSSCEKNERLVYSEIGSVYFKDFSDKADSLMVSLATKKEGVDTTYVKIRLLGQYLKTPKKFKAKVILDKTTAKEGVHYKKFKEFYLFPKDTSVYKMPIILIKGDAELKKKPVVLAFKLEADELNTGFTDKQQLRVKFSDMFMPPVGTSRYGNMTYFVKLFGVYSQKKHQMIFDYLGEDLPTKRYGMYYKYRDPKWQACSKALSKYCKEHEVFDENGKRIKPWR